MQVCTSSGKTGTTQPLQAYQAGHAYSNGNTIVDANGNKQTVTRPGTSSVSKTLTTSDITNGVATYTTSTNHGYAVGQQVTITSSSHNAAFNVVNAIITSIPTAATVRPVPACVTPRRSSDNDAMRVSADVGGEADARSATVAACGSGGLVAAGRCGACRHSRDSGRHH